ncbi:hypothetical protein K491DRAFT_765353 [Lophiostoma macrostomum CBS 122681]|uniref:Alpha/beta hydrolase fold-3 domain-containing protein n=1 Tax=Lophiostoma macrostomum CBS 122681 TaxID=1314788 RepID=A0A6A6TKQ2_9PLEO|nr:hypothetical protein K491DRAFT_765353 [Lophiostoma macrostomum CBS 122681]
MPSKIPKVGTRTKLNASISAFLESHPDLRLGGAEDFHKERRKHLDVFGLHNLPKDGIHPIGEVEFTAICGPHGTIPKRKEGEAAALVYMHGGGYTVGSVDEFENGLGFLAEESGVRVYVAEYRPAPEWRFPVQFDAYSAVVDWLQSSGGKERGVHPDRVCGGGDSAGGNMTATLCLRRRDQEQKAMAAQILLYPEARLPFDTPAASENKSGYYLECNGIFSFADHYLPRGTPPGHKYISPGMQKLEELKDLPPAAVFTSGFDPLRDVGVEYATRLQEAGNKMTAWSEDTGMCVKEVAAVMKELV